ncbi:hypothetical protein [Tepidibacter thalassicus]|uniref:Cell surface protein n=1 Tax=Tepidibacter thalassicus DSM 15285 TaxID=1123350 RepID=A0A1M5PWU8_9FIRM|nr:hypothetical protein [Tepidibacter thalassicus]SHH06497.1 hypothetical protein SAMN02744040_00663 [Tepidibacter thalassicus DSM 15285]
MKKILKWGLIAFIGLIIICAIAGGENDNPNESSEPASATATATQEETIVTETANYIVDDGMYKVGTDIQPGEYLIVADGMAYYELDKDSSGNLESVISNDNFTINRYIQIKEGEYLKLKNCKLYAVDKAPELAVKEMYKVGYDLQAGEYKVVAEGMGYYEVAKNARGGVMNIVANENFEGETYITVQDGQYLKLQNAKLK